MNLDAAGRSILCGTGGGESALSMDGVVPVAVAGVPCGLACLLTADEVIYTSFRANHWYLEAYALTTGSTRFIGYDGANTLRAGGGVWAAQTGGTLRTSAGARRDNTEVMAVSPDGLIYAVDYQSARTHVYVFDARLTLVSAFDSPASVLAMSALSGLRAAWTATDGTSYAFGLPDFVQQPNPTYAIALTPSGYVMETNNWGMTVRPWSSARGWIVRVGEAWHPDLIDFGSGLLVGWAKGAGELQTDYLQPTPLDVSAPLVPLDPPMAPVVIPTFAPTTVPLWDLDNDPVLPHTHLYGEIGPTGWNASGSYIGGANNISVDRMIAEAQHTGEIVTLDCDGRTWDDAAQRVYEQFAAVGVHTQCLDGSGFGSETLTTDELVSAYTKTVGRAMPIFANYRHAEWLGGEQGQLDLVKRVRDIAVAHGIAGTTFGVDRASQTTAALVEEYRRMHVAVTAAPIPVPPIPVPPAEEKPMARLLCFETLVSKTQSVYEANMAIPSVNARAASVDERFSAWCRWIAHGLDKGWDDGQRVILECETGPGRFLSLDAKGDAICTTDGGAVWTIHKADGGTWALRHGTGGWLVFEQNPGDAPTYRATVRAADQAAPSAWDMLTVYDAETRKVLDTPFK